MCRKEIYSVCNFSYSCLYNRPTRGKFLRFYYITNIVQIIRHTNCEFNIRVKKDQRGWSKLNHTITLKEMIWINLLKKTRYKNPSQIGVEVRRLGPKLKIQSLNTRPISSAGAVAYRVISSILYQELWTSFPEK